MNGQLCLDTNEIISPTKGAYIDPLTGMWSNDKSILIKGIKKVGLNSLEQSQAIVDGMKRYEFWDEASTFIVDTGEIEKGDIKFYSKNDLLLDTAIEHFYLHMNVGVYYKGMPPGDGIINNKKNYMFKSRMVNEEELPRFLFIDSPRVLDGFRADQITTLLTKFIRPGGIVINLSGDIGITTISLCNSFFVRVVEPDPILYSILRYNCELAGIPYNRYITYNNNAIYKSDAIFFDNTPSKEEEILYLLKYTKILVIKTIKSYNFKKTGYQVYTYASYRKGDTKTPLFYLHFITKKMTRYPQKDHISFKLI